jgi:plasmid maintenance system killer protein
MEVRSRATRLRTCYERHRGAERNWGAAVARRLIQRINILKAAETVQDFRTMRALRFHALKGGEGQYALTLDRRPRLIVSFPGPGIVQVEEVSRQHGD